jgi:hypothetical protein
MLFGSAFFVVMVIFLVAMVIYLVAMVSFVTNGSSGLKFGFQRTRVPQSLFVVFLISFVLCLF